MVKHWAKVIEETKKLCEVGLGDDSKYYESIGMEQMEVAQGSDGRWYVKGYEPGHSIPDAKQKQATGPSSDTWAHSYLGPLS